jgi:D-alanyl-lipoteichoic acid acyltransferase DltB (MBOAT superfamily)
MFVSGVWRGTGYQFILCGLLHGTGLVVNHAWQLAPHLSAALGCLLDGLPPF